jgi:cystathionine beta-lyase
MSAGPAPGRRAAVVHPYHEGFDGLDLDVLARRPGVKWARAQGSVAAWVADMDFPPCPPVTARLHALIDGGDLGYPDWHGGTPLRTAFAERAARLWDWHPDPGAVREISDLIQGLQIVIDLATRPGDAVAMHVPTYPPFLATVASMARRLVPIPMVRGSSGGADGADGAGGATGWGFDPAAMDDAVAASGARLLVLVNPQNPTGRVLTRAELEAVAGTARRHDLIVWSDEIHADLVYAPHRHVPFASLSDDAAARTVTLTSASKAFNLAGLRTAVMHVGPAGLLAARDAQPPDLYGAPHLFGVHAALAAWTEGDAWLATLVDHLDHNRRRVAEAVAGWPGVELVLPEATYLAWLDVRGAGLGPRPGSAFARGRVRLSPGEEFGPGGEGFVRLNFATSAEVLEEALVRMATTLGA